MNQVRIVRYHVQLEVVVDDGTNLTPLPVAPLSVNAVDWPQFSASGLAAAIEELQSRVGGTSEA